jgi:hypothetical protein
MNIDCEIYIKNFVTFFDNNPNDLRNLIGNVEKDIFYDKVRNAVYKKCDEGDDYILTQQELLKILVDIYNQHIKSNGSELFIQQTNFGPLFLN